MIPEGGPLRGADVAESFARNSPFLNRILERFFANAGQFAEFDGAEPLVLGDGFVEGGELLLDAVHRVNQMEE